MFLLYEVALETASCPTFEYLAVTKLLTTKARLTEGNGRHKAVPFHRFCIHHRFYRNASGSTFQYFPANVCLYSVYRNAARLVYDVSLSYDTALTRRSWDPSFFLFSFPMIGDVCVIIIGKWRYSWNISEWM